MALAGIVTAASPSLLEANVPFVAAVAVSTWYGGKASGLVAAALALCGLTGLGFVAGRAFDPYQVVLHLAGFPLVVFIIGQMTQWLRRATREARTDAAELESYAADLDRRMQHASAELEASNRSLTQALADAENVASHTLSLQETTAALSQAMTELEVADVVLGKGLGVVESIGGVLVRVNGEGFEIIRASWYEPAVQTGELALMTHHEGPLAEVVRTLQPLWVSQPEEHLARFPHVAEQIGTCPEATVTIPLCHGGEIVGALGLTFADASAFGAINRGFTLLLAQAAGDALFRARSYDAERFAREGAETLAQARADVLGIVAHDLRDPLNVILATSEMLLDSDILEPSERDRMLDVLQRSVERMSRLIGDLLDATRLQAGRLTLDLADIDARKVLREAEETLSPYAANRRITLRSHAPRTCCVRADEGRLLQVIGNLVGNALKFTDVGGSVSISAQPSDLEVIFSVCDNGPGIPPEHQSRLFDSFWQATNGDRRGVGLGLSITKDIVQALGGRIWVESTVGVGSTFSFSVPSTEAGC